MSITIEDRIKVYLEDYPNKTSKELASIIKYSEELTNSFNSINKANLAKLITSIKNPKPASDTSFYSIITGCDHLPFHDPEMWDSMVHLGNWLSTIYRTRLVLAGDIVDMNSISRHNRGNVSKIPGLTLTEEYRLANLELDKFDYGNYISKDYLYGNHEAWYYSYMSMIDNAKLGEGVIKSPTEGLRLWERGYQVHHNYMQDSIKVGNLIVTHGNYVNIHASQAHLNAYKENVLFFHTHRMGMFVDSGPNNTNITGYNGGFGGLRYLPAFNYMPEDMKKKWQNGFSVTYTDNQGETYVTLLQWKNNKFVFMNREFSATGIKVIGE